MKVKYRQSLYEMTLFRSIQFRMHKLWFPGRRMLRRGLRILRYLVSWIAPFFLFSFMVCAVYLALIEVGLLGFEQAVIEAVGVIVGSFLLLFIKECWDLEHARHAQLLAQWSSYIKYKSNLTGLLLDLYRALGFSVVGYYNLLSTADALSSFIEKRFVDPNSRVSMSCQSIVKSLHECLLSFKKETESTRFLDWPEDERASFSFQRALSLVSSLATGEVDGSIDRLSVADDVSRACLELLGYLRRPWNYPIDRARARLLDRFVSTFGEKLNR